MARPSEPGLVVIREAGPALTSRNRGIERLFADHLDRGWHPAAALAVYVGDGLAVDLWGGHVDAARTIPADGTTMFVGFSCGKPLAAACLWVLRERGRLAWDDPVARHWPEFAKNGKSAVTVGHVLTHRAGLPTTPAPVRGVHLDQHRKAAGLLAAASPEYPPGSAIEYHSVTFGWLVAELVERISGRPFRDFFESEVKGPLGLRDTYFGRPPEAGRRVAVLTEAEGIDQPRVAELFNLPRIQEAVIPAASVTTTARDLARFYAAMNGRGRVGGVRWLKHETVEEATSAHAEGPDRADSELRRWGLGVQLGGSHTHALGLGADSNPRTCAHGGYSTSIAWGDPDSGVAMAYLTAGVQTDETNNRRLRSMSEAVRAAFR